MISLGLDVIKARLTLSSNDVNMHQETITSYAEVASHLLGRYTTDTVIVKAADKIKSNKQGSLTPWDFSKNLADLGIFCGFVYNEQTLWGFFTEVVELTICNTKWNW